MEHLVVNSKTAEKLKAAGFPQQSVCYYAEDVLHRYFLILGKLKDYRTSDLAAPTAQEIANQLTAVEDRVWNVEPVWQGESDKSYVVSEPGGDVTVTPGIHLFYGDSIVDVLAQLWLNKHEVQS